MPAAIEKAKKEPYQIRDYRLLLSLLKSHNLHETKEGQRMLKLVGKPADRAQSKLDRPRGTPEKEDFDKALAACWESFSLYIRTRDTVPCGESRRGKCVTCENYYDIKKLQCGHWIPTANWGTKLHEMNNHGQCWPCNDKMRGNGKMPEHEKAIRERHGDHVPDMLRRLKQTHGRKLNAKELWAKKEEFDRKLENYLGRETAGELRQ